MNYSAISDLEKLNASAMTLVAENIAKYKLMETTVTPLELCQVQQAVSGLIHNQSAIHKLGMDVK